MVFEPGVAGLVTAEAPATAWRAATGTASRAVAGVRVRSSREERPAVPDPSSGAFVALVEAAGLDEPVTVVATLADGRTVELLV